MLKTVLMIAAVACFVIAAIYEVIGKPHPLAWVATGLAFWSLTSLI
jgi:hypothetical protein